MVAVLLKIALLTIIDTAISGRERSRLDEGLAGCIQLTEFIGGKLLHKLRHNGILGFRCHAIEISFTRQTERIVNISASMIPHTSMRDSR